MDRRTHPTPGRANPPGRAAALPLERFSDLVGLVYDSALAERQWKALMEAICDAFPGCAMTAMASDGSARAWQFEHAGATPDEIAFVRANLDAQNDVQRIGHAQFAALEPGFVVRSRKYLGAAFHDTTLYRNLLRPLGFGHYMQMKLGAHEERFVYFFLSIREGAPDAERLYDDLFEVLRLLAPHVVRAAEIARGLRLAREASHLLAGGLDTVVLPMAIVDADRALLFINAAGRRMIDRRGTLALDAAGRLTLPRPDETRRLGAELARAGDLGRPGGLRIDDPDGPLSVLVMPFHPALDPAARMDGALYGGRRACAVFVGQTEADAVDPGLLGDVFDLTEREALVCRDLLGGRSPAEIARAAGRSERTVRNQVQAIYAKLGVTSHRAFADRLLTFRTVSQALVAAAGRPGDRGARALG